MTDVLIYGDTFRSPELRHEVPLGIPDPFLYVERDGSKHIAIGAMEIPRLAELGAVRAASRRGVRLRRPDRARASRYAEVRRELALRAVAEARRDERDRARRTSRSGSPTSCAPTGVELTVDGEFFDDRRRVKTEPQLAGIRRAQRAAEAGMDAARDLFRRATPNGDGLAGRRRAADRRAGEGRDERRRSPSTARPPTTSSSRPGRRAPSGTTWARARSAPACRS